MISYALECEDWIRTCPFPKLFGEVQSTASTKGYEVGPQASHAITDKAKNMSSTIQRPGIEEVVQGCI